MAFQSLLAGRLVPACHNLLSSILLHPPFLVFFFSITLTPSLHPLTVEWCFRADKDRKLRSWLYVFTVHWLVNNALLCYRPLVRQLLVKYINNAWKKRVTRLVLDLLDASFPPKVPWTFRSRTYFSKNYGKRFIRIQFRPWLMLVKRN